jgi:hypothetical protein
MKTREREIIMTQPIELHNKLSSAPVDVNEWPDFSVEECRRYNRLMDINFFIPRGIPVGQEAFKKSCGFGFTAAKRARHKALAAEKDEALS